MERVSNKEFLKERIDQAINNTFLPKDKSLHNEQLRSALRAELYYAYYSDSYKEHLLCDIGQDRVFKHIMNIEAGEEDSFYPLTSTLDEITLYLSQKPENIGFNFIQHSEELYRKLNNFPITSNSNISIIEDQERCIYNISFDNAYRQENRKMRIAVASMYLPEEEAINADKTGLFPNTYNIREFKHLIDMAKRFGADIIIFPEFALPEKYALDIAKHCRKRKISIVTGLTHKNINGNLVNLILIRDNDINLALFKWKNYMPIKEKKICLEQHCGYSVPQQPYYFIIDNGKCKYSTMTCFEATSIVDRALLCDKIELLLMLVFNQDTFYFSNIISSFVRDASCFIAQSNSNIYGDSRISGPFKQVEMDVVKLKGGINNYFVVGELDFDLLSEKNKAGEMLELDIDNKASTLPKWNDKLKKALKYYEKNKIKPISAGHKRYSLRKNNGLDL